MLTNYLKMSQEATKEAIRYDVMESEARKAGDDQLAAYLLSQAKHYRHQSRKYLRLHNNER